MPNYGTRTSPWVGSGDMGDTFFQFMTTMSALKNRQAEHADEMAYHQAALAQQKPLVDAQVGHYNAAIGAENAKTAMLGKVAGNAEDAGLWSFANEMSQSPNYNPLQESRLPDTAENRQLLTRAMLTKSLMGNAATSPEASAQMQRPVGANAGEVMYAPISGRVIGRGMPKTTLHNVPPGGKLFDETGIQLAENPASEDSKLHDLGAIYHAASGNVNALGKPDSFGDAPYQKDERLKGMYNDSLDMVSSFGSMIKNKLRSQNNVAPHTNADSGDESNTLPVGTIHKGYRFRGGDPANKNNWEKVQ